MPVVTVTLLPFYPPEVEARLVGRLARATRSVIHASQAGTTVFVQHASTYQRDGRVLTAGGAVVPDGSALVQSFLQRMQDRDLPAASALLAPDFTMQFPASGPMHRLEELLAWAGARYRQIAKRYDGFDECWDDDATIVYCRGTLYGTWLDGRSFEGIRFIDRFRIVDGLISRQDVWNDLGEVRAAAALANPR